VGAAVKHARGKRGPGRQFSTRRRVERLQQRLQTERDARVIESIRAQLAAFERPLQGPHG
jgi:hypothetical protein